MANGDNYTDIALQIGLFGLTPTPNELNVMLVWRNIFIIATYKAADMVQTNLKIK